MNRLSSSPMIADWGCGLGVADWGVTDCGLHLLLRWQSGARTVRATYPTPYP